MATILATYAAGAGQIILLDVGGQPVTTHFASVPTAPELASRIDEIERRMLDEVVADKFNESEES